MSWSKNQRWMSPLTTFLLDKNIVRGVFETRVRALRGIAPLPHQMEAALVYRALGRQDGVAVYVTLESVNAARRRDPVIAASITTSLNYLTKGRYLRRWARRLRNFGFTREDAFILSYGSFGVDTQRRTIGVEVIVTADEAMIRNFELQAAAILRRFQRMTRQLRLPYHLAQLPTLATPTDVLAMLMR